MPLGAVATPDGAHLAVVLSGWREQGVQIVDLRRRQVTQTIHLPGAFIGIAFGADGRSFFVSGSYRDLVYRFAWNGESAALTDSLPLEPAPAAGARPAGRRYPAGVGVSPDGRTLYVAENLGDSLAVIDLASRTVVQRLATERYPYGVAVAPDGRVYVSAWGGQTVSAFAPAPVGRLREAGRIRVARHPSGLLLSRDGSRLFVASGSTDRVSVVDTRAGRVVTDLLDPPPAGPGEGSTPNALALSADGGRLFVAEADNNAVACFDLRAETAGIARGRGDDALVGRIPVEWYPAALVAVRDTLLVVNGKGRGTASHLDGPGPMRPRETVPHAYTLGELSGSLTTIDFANAPAGALAPYAERVAAANGWRESPRPRAYPPFDHVIYVIKENRTYDQVLGDMPEGDGDSSLVFFPRPVSPNHHALAERFGLYDRFFTNAEVSPDGHNWSTAAYATDYVEKTVPSEYSSRGRSYDYEGTNRGFSPGSIPDDDVAEPANGYLWTAAQRAGISFRNFGEFVVRDGDSYVGDKPFLATHTQADYPGFDLAITDQRRVESWLVDFARRVAGDSLPQLEVVRLPNDHTAGTRAGMPTPRAYVADNDLALGKMVEALSRSRYWRNTVMFVVEDDAQNGPDHVDSHRSELFVISAYNRGGVMHRWVNTTDVLATIGDILHLGRLSQFDYYGRPLVEVFARTPDMRPYTLLTPAVALDERNAANAPGARESEALDFSAEDRADENAFNRVLWRAIKGDSVPYPGVRRVPLREITLGGAEASAPRRER